MNKNKIKNYKIVLLVSFIIIALLVIPNFIVSFINNDIKIAPAKLESNQNSAQIQSIAKYNVGTGSVVGGEHEATSFHGAHSAIVDSMPLLYCYEYGANIATAGDITIEQAKNYGSTNGTKKNWGTRHRYNCPNTSVAYGSNYHWPCTNNGKSTNPILKSSGTVQDIAGTNPALAYVLTSSNSWNEKIQFAVWALQGSDVSSKYDTSLASQGQAYASFINKASNDVIVQDNTDKEKISTSIKYSEKESEATCIVGPLNVSYLDGNLDGVTFAGISGMYAIGYNSKGKVVKEKIELLKYYDKNGESHELSYFTPNSNYVDNNSQSYPKPDEDFYVQFSNPNANMNKKVGESGYEDELVSHIKIHVDFNWMKCTSCSISNVDAYKYTVCWEEREGSHRYYIDSYNRTTGTTERTYYTCPTCTGTSWLEKSELQDHINVVKGTRELFKSSLNITGPDENGIPILMDLGGHVWEDGIVDDKGNKAGEKPWDGLSNTSVDKPLENVIVTLYDQDNKEVGSTLTNKNGNYVFKNIDSMKKYHVTFTYNGQTYIPTDFSASIKNYNTDNWKLTSKALENDDERKAFDGKFEEIGSYPNNYKITSNIFGKAGKYNATYSELDLMGYTLNENGEYKQTGLQLIDGYVKDEKGNETYKEGIITKAIKAKMEENEENKFFTKDLTSIYEEYGAKDSELQNKLQFIEDCRIKSYTKIADAEKRDLYPVYNNFTINYKKYETIEDVQKNSYDMTIKVFDSQEYRPIYPGQYFVNLGLWRRQIADLAIRKDAYMAALKINDKTIVYKYDKRLDAEDYWNINVRMSDYEAYYKTDYNREIYQSDYDYKSTIEHPGKELEIYVTYKITIRNQGEVLAEVKELVDYYDKDYTYIDELSWIKYEDEKSISDDEYYNAIVEEKISNARKVDSSETSKYASERNTAPSNITQKYNAIYVKGLANKKLANGERAYVYLTFKVNKKDGKVILDDENDAKQNIAELNGYVTYYQDGTELPNGVTKGSEDKAGLIDIDSNPGNLQLKDIQGDYYEKNFEDDTDRAKGLRIKIYENAIRQINGTVWEDERTNEIKGAVIGDGIRNKDEIGINGVTVQLVEKTTNGKEYIWQETTTKTIKDEKGKYTFEGYIPGNYIVRFYYGNTEKTVKISQNGGENAVSYNGQDFKSTIYQVGLDSDLGNNETGTYKYNIKNADACKNMVSDAKDIWSRRQNVNNYSNSNVKNHVAEVLASPYQTKIDDNLINELIDKTSMVAETGVIDVQFEYDRSKSDGLNSTNNDNVVINSYNNQNNGNYVIANLDFGLTERPKAQLELNKKVSNIKITLANGNVLFDANKSVENLIWVPNTKYNLNKNMSDNKYKEYYGDSKYNRYSYREEVDKLIDRLYGGGQNGLLQVTMDEELMHGATIQIKYLLTVTNVGETDYEGTEFYYLGKNGTKVVTTTANNVVDYVSNNLQFRKADNEKDWKTTKTEDLITDGLVNGTLKEKLDEFNTIIQTSSFSKELKPTESTGEVQLLLTQTITSQNAQSNDNMIYSNIAEIVATSNSVGRRMAYSIVGNQDPTQAPKEVDSFKSEEVIILPPFGNPTYLYVIIAIAVVTILSVGIIFIKKKVIK